MDEPASPLPPPAAPIPPEEPAILAGDARGWPQQPRATNSNKTLIGIAIGGCVFIFLGFVAFIGFLGWLGWRAGQEQRLHGKPGTEQPNGKPLASQDGRGTDPSQWIGSDDYPADALDRGEEGTVAIAWEVSPDGLPLRCTVTQSSGHPSLDTAACAAIMRHARYAALPAGQVTVRQESRRVVWRLPGGGGGK